MKLIDAMKNSSYTKRALKFFPMLFGLLLGMQFFANKITSIEEFISFLPRMFLGVVIGSIAGVMTQELIRYFFHKK